MYCINFAACSDSEEKRVLKFWTFLCRCCLKSLAKTPCQTCGWKGCCGQSRIKDGASEGVRVGNISQPELIFCPFWLSSTQKEIHNQGRRFAAALLPRLFWTNPRSHHKGATSRVRTGNQRLPVLCHCQLGQDIPNQSMNQQIFPTLGMNLRNVTSLGPNFGPFWHR